MHTVSPQLIPEAELQEIRFLFPHTALGLTYLNHAAASPMSTRVIDAISSHLRDRSAGKLETWEDDLKMIQETRRLVQQLINAESADRIALVANTSDALNIIASGLDWRPGDRILLNDLEFPANVYPYLHLRSQGVEIDFAAGVQGRVTPELIYKALKPRTVVLALSAVQFLSGYLADLKVLGEICRSRGILFIVDGIQAVGARSIDVQRMHIDALAAGSQKWQMGPQGTGFLYLTEELQARVHQKYLGWLGVENPFNFLDLEQPPAKTARRYEGGTPNIPGIWGLQAALTTLLERGIPTIESHILALTRILMDELQEIEGIRLLSPLKDDERAGIVTIEFGANIDPDSVFKELNKKKILVSLRNGKIRFSPHYYNTKGEVLLAAEAIKACCPQRASASAHVSPHA